MREPRTPVLLGAEDGEFRWGMDGSLSRFIVPSAMTGGAYAIVEDTVAAGDGIPLHRHPEDDEVFYVLDGEITFFVGDRPPYHATQGAVVMIPGGTPHAFKPTSRTAKYLIVTTPRHAEFYRAISRAAPSRDLPPSEPMDMDEIERACEEFGVEILGPPPGTIDNENR